MENMFDLFEVGQEVADPVVPLSLPSPTQGTVQFDNVSFSYALDKPDTLRNVSFTAPAGHTIAFVCHSCQE